MLNDFALHTGANYTNNLYAADPDPDMEKTLFLNAKTKNNFM